MIKLTWLWILLFCLLGWTACEKKTVYKPFEPGQYGALSEKKDQVDRQKKKPKIGTIIDRFNGVAVYYNGNLRHTEGRNVTSDGYNLGLKWQCVEFVKRYYYLKLQHKMPNPWGHAIDFFDTGLRDGARNKQRNLYQFTNPSKTKPKAGDIIVFKGEKGNPYGHVAIVSKVGANYVEVVQQNVGRQTRYTLPLFDMVDSWRIANIDVLGWLGKR